MFLNWFRSPFMFSPDGGGGGQATTYPVAGEDSYGTKNPVMPTGEPEASSDNSADTQHFAGKFETVDELEKGYKNLQAHTTRVSQELSQMKQEFAAVKQHLQSQQPPPEAQPAGGDNEAFISKFVESPHDALKEALSPILGEYLSPIQAAIQRQNALANARQAQERFEDLKTSPDAIRKVNEQFQKRRWLSQLDSDNGLEIAYQLATYDEKSKRVQELEQELVAAQKQLQQRQRRASFAHPSSGGGQPGYDRPGKNGATVYGNALKRLKAQGHDVSDLEYTLQGQGYLR